ncbi:hypothetical protein MMC18_005630 [Xylographa bjoerkii]|nr:hypothetical protein [Xylographa bjoerkii]
MSSLEMLLSILFLCVSSPLVFAQATYTNSSRTATYTGVCPICTYQAQVDVTFGVSDEDYVHQNVTVIPHITQYNNGTDVTNFVTEDIPMTTEIATAFNFSGSFTVTGSTFVYLGSTLTVGSTYDLWDLPAAVTFYTSLATGCSKIDVTTQVATIYTANILDTSSYITAIGPYLTAAASSSGFYLTDNLGACTTPISVAPAILLPAVSLTEITGAAITTKVTGRAPASTIPAVPESSAAPAAPARTSLAFPVIPSPSATLLLPPATSVLLPLVSSPLSPPTVLPPSKSPTVLPPPASPITSAASSLPSSLLAAPPNSSPAAPGGSNPPSSPAAPGGNTAPASSAAAPGANNPSASNLEAPASVPQSPTAGNQPITNAAPSASAPIFPSPLLSVESGDTPVTLSILGPNPNPSAATAAPLQTITAGSQVLTFSPIGSNPGGAGPSASGTPVPVVVIDSTATLTRGGVATIGTIVVSLPSSGSFLEVGTTSVILSAAVPTSAVSAPLQTITAGSQILTFSPITSSPGGAGASASGAAVVVIDATATLTRGGVATIGTVVISLPSSGSVLEVGTIPVIISAAAPTSVAPQVITAGSAVITLSAGAIGASGGSAASALIVDGTATLTRGGEVTVGTEVVSLPTSGTVLEAGGTPIGLGSPILCGIGVTSACATARATSSLVSVDTNAAGRLMRGRGWVVAVLGMGGWMVF